MCGITGVWGKSDLESVRAMMNLMVHRGPDAEGSFSTRVTDGVLGHRRLSIMDPEGGDQPIFDEAGSRAIVANGEIYNFPSLHQDLASRHRFVTSSDTEAVIHL